MITCLQVCFYFRRSSLKVLCRLSQNKGSTDLFELSDEYHIVFLKYFLFYLKEKNFHMDCCKRKTEEVLTACELYSLNCLLPTKQIFYHCSCSPKKLQSSHARECSQRPFVTPSSPNGSSQFYSPEERKEKSCFLCACYLLFDPHYQQQNN